MVEMRYGTVRMSTNIDCREEDWDDNSEMVLSSDRMYRHKNKVLGDMVIKITPYLSNPINNDDFKELYYRLFRPDRCVKKEKVFLDYWDEFVATKTKKGTMRTYDNARKKVEAFDGAATFNSINKGWLMRFEASMQKDDLAVNYISIIMRCMRAVFNYCIDCEYTTCYPFRRFQIKQEETRKRSISVEDLRMFRDYQVEPHQEKYRDCFMLSFYLIGINLTDLFSLTHDSVKDGYVTYRRAKTGKPYRIKIEPEAQAILDRYKGDAHLLSLADEWGMDNFRSRADRELKRIGPFDRKGRGGKKVFEPLFPHLSMYWARHTWATIASKIDIPIETIGHALGHSDESHSVTNIYIRFDEAKIDEANRKVLDYVSGNTPE